MKSIYLDNGATSYPKAPGVGAAMAHYIDEIGANVNRGTYKQATDAAMTVLETRSMLKELFHFAGKETHVLFTPGATAGLNQILLGFLHPGDHVIVDSLAHNAVMRPLVELAKEGVEFSRIPASREGLSDPSDIEKLIRPNTKLMLITHASNVCGALFPLEEAAELCKAHGIPLAVDAAQTAGHYPIDFSKLGLAALCMPGHKGLLGPQGIGALLLSESFASSLRPILTGGTGSASDSEEQPLYMPDRFESGTQNLPGIFGLHTALRFILEQTPQTLRTHEMRLCMSLIEGLSELPLRIVGPMDEERRVGVVAIDFTDQDNALIAYRLESEHGILSRCGLHCAPNAHKTLGTFPQGSVRLSVGYATDEDEIKRTLEAVRAVLQ